MSKIKTLHQVASTVQRLKRDGKTVGLITGCFDLLHIGHIQLFRFAKKHCDIVVVGLDSDQTIRLSKGPGRPLHNLKQRSEALAEFVSIDLIFPIETTVNFNKDANTVYYKLAEKILPDFLVTTPASDRFWKEKEKRAKDLGARLLKNTKKGPSSSSAVAERLRSEL